MYIIPGIVEKGKVQVSSPLLAEDGTSVMIFIMPKTIEINSRESLFGKWKWYSKNIDGEILNAWEKWSEKPNIF